MSVYVHVPFCARRCGYCDFNTYASSQLGPGVSQKDYANLVLAEFELLQAKIGAPVAVPTVFFGGGTPTLLPVSDLVKILSQINQSWPLASDAEVTTEANPDSVSEKAINQLAAGGFTRISLGMQSAVPQVLQTLDRTHDPKQVKRAVQWAKAAGMQVSVDLIYGTPGETLSDWKTSVQTALDLEVNHISAYALSLEPHTKMGRAVARGLLPAPDDDDAASKYELADEMFAAGGLSWYEISNWARGGPTGPNVCRHNLAYWRGNDWVGLGPGAHSHLSGTRWWNVLHPRQYAALLQQGELPIAEKEQLTPKQAALEKVMLGLRLAEGLPISAVESGVLRDAAPSSSSQIGELIAAGLICGTTAESERRIRLTRSGRLLADLVTQKLT